MNEDLHKLAANDRPEADATADAQDSYARARETVRDLLDKAPSARAVVAAGRDYYRRGAAAVTRTAGDNMALTFLAAGVAVAAVSWLVLGRKGKPGA